MIELRQYQTELINKARQALHNGFMAPLIVSPTGSGKTVMFADITRRATEKGANVIILVHRREILEQTISSLFNLGITAGQIISGRPMTPGNNVQVAMVGTLVHRLKKVSKPDLLIIDECHHSPAGQWQKIIDSYSQTPRLGFTATPVRLDGVGLGDNHDIMIKGPTIATLVRDGFLAYPRMKTPSKEIINKYHITRGDFDKKEQFEAMGDKVIVGDVIENYRQHFDGLPAITFCVSIEHCNVMNKAFNDARIKSVVVHGKMKKSEREAAIKGLGDGTFNTIISCDVISEGVDIPVTAGTIHLRKTGSESLFLQQAGRGLRIFPGKKEAIILDHVGNYHLHGHVMQDRNWDLFSGKRDIKKMEAAITRCPSCFEVWPGKIRKCPGCGHVMKAVETAKDILLPETVAGILQDVLPDAEKMEIESLKNFIIRINTYDKDKRRKAMMAKSYELADRNKIEALRRAVGYNDGWTNWAWNIVKNKGQNLSI